MVESYKMKKYKIEKCLVCGKEDAIIWTCSKCTYILYRTPLKDLPDYVSPEQKDYLVAERIKKYVKENNITK